VSWLPVIDWCLLVFACLFPIYSVLCWKQSSGILFGMVAVWGSVILAFALEWRVEPQNRGFIDLLVTVAWVLFGWLVALAYCYLIVLAKIIVRELREFVTSPKVS
jgi:hypothetical protein